MAAVALALCAVAARATVVDIAWSGGDFRHEARIEPGGFIEVCGPLQAGRTVRWQFNADAPLDFNIHYHAGMDVRYPARHDGVSRLQGALLPDAAQDHCWMWSNAGTAPARLRLQLQRRR